ncbi:Folylpolyglutamate synthetase, partial [Coemansia erecta]
MCTETNAACCHFEHASSDPLPLKIESYESAVKDLGGLQSNYATVQMVRATGGLLNQHSIPELEAFMEKIGYNVDDLDKLNIIHVTGTKGKG